MWAPARRAVIAVLLLSLAVCAASKSPLEVHRSPNRFFPLLSHLKDKIVELVFGQHPNKHNNSESFTLQALQRQYAGEVVLRFNTSSIEEAAALSASCNRLFLDVWATTPNFTDVRLHSDDVAPLLSLLPRTLHSSHRAIISDVATAIYTSLPSTSASRPQNDKIMDASTSPLPADNLFFQDYQPLPVIVRWMRLLEAMFPSHVEYITIGKSYENRDIPALRIGVARSNESGPRKTLVITGGLHAREWISTTTVNYVAWSFITLFGKEPMITKFLYNFEIIFVPVMNPDGVEYSWQFDRLWRKSRQHTNFRFCKGLDLDHAFGFGWESSKSDPCSESYGGEQPFQAAEARSLANWARNETRNNVKFVGLLDLHAYSQQILFPYSHSCAVEPPNMENLQELAAGIAKSIRLSNGQVYSVASACEVPSATSALAAAGLSTADGESIGGSAIDWFYHEMRGHFSYQIKLRDTGSYGFLLPKDQIIPSGEEMFDALKYVGDYLLGNNGIERMQKPNEQDSVDHEDDMELRRRVIRKF